MLLVCGRGVALATNTTPGNREWFNVGGANPFDPFRRREIFIASGGFSWDGEKNLRDRFWETC